ncbi:MAG TPA: AMP-binding protein, partial [Acidimicrobiales bacterium]
MGLSFQEANAVVGGPGSPFEIITVELDGVSNRTFKNAPSTLRQIFDTARGLDQTFIVYEDEEWTFAEVMEEVDALGYALVHHYGVKPGDRVGIAMRNYPEWIISFAAILSIGAISVSMNAWWSPQEMEYAINDAELTVMIGDTERIERGADACHRANVRVLGVRLDALAPLAADVEHWSDVVVRGVAMPDVELHADMDATILYTSGTTGFPKGAVTTHGTICQTVYAFTSA